MLRAKLIDRDAEQSKIMALLTQLNEMLTQARAEAIDPLEREVYELTLLELGDLPAEFLKVVKRME